MRTDPPYQVGDPVVTQDGRKAIVRHAAWEIQGESAYVFKGYWLEFADGSFSGWHPADELRKAEDK